MKRDQQEKPAKLTNKYTAKLMNYWLRKKKDITTV